MRKRFLTAIVGMGLMAIGLAAFAVTGCETEATIAYVNKGRTLVLSGVPAGSQVGRADVFAEGAEVSTAAAVGGGVADGTGISNGGDVTVNIQPYTGSFSADTYQITVDVDGIRRRRSGVSLKASAINLSLQDMDTIQAAKRGISLRQSGRTSDLVKYAFDTVKEGDAVPAALSVDITNTGLEPTGNLKVTLIDDSGIGTSVSFTLSAENSGSAVTTRAIAGIPANTSVSGAFQVRPRGGLEAGSYGALVEVRGDDNNIMAVFIVSFKVEAPDIVEPTPPAYSITLSGGDKNPLVYYPWTILEGSNTPPAPLQVVAKNEGPATGKLDVTISADPPGSFTLFPDSIASIAEGAIVNAFLIYPNGKDLNKQYVAYVAVKRGADILAHFAVSSIVTEPPKTYTISLSHDTGDNPLDFGSVKEDYKSITAKTVTITNKGNQSTGELTVELSKKTDGYPFEKDEAPFVLSKTTIKDTDFSASTKKAAFTVKPADNLDVGNHEAIVTVSGANDISASFNVIFTVEDKEYSIELSEIEAGTISSNSKLAFGSLIEGYTSEDIAAKSKTITIRNTGEYASEELKVELLAGTDAASFVLSTTTPPTTSTPTMPSITIPSITGVNGKGTAAFNVVPKHGLDPKDSYTATVEVSGNTEKNAKMLKHSFTVSFKVEDKTYDISFLDESNQSLTSHTFDSKVEPSTAVDPKTVKVKNEGNQETGELTVSLGDNTDFEITDPADGVIDSIPVGGTATFKVRPTTNLAAGPHDGKVIVSGEHFTGDKQKEFPVSFKVEAKTYIISLKDSNNVPLSNNSPLSLGALPPNYGEANITNATKAVTITNEGNQPTGPLTIGLSQGGSDWFTLSTNSIAAGIEVDDNNSFTIAPKLDIPANDEDEYSATVTVSGTNITQTFTVNFTVQAVNYGISLKDSNGKTLSNDSPLDLGSRVEGETQPVARPVSITNTGNQPTGELTVSLVDNTDFVITDPPNRTIGSIAKGYTGTFAIAPKSILEANGYEPKTYTETVTVRKATDNTNDIAPQTFKVTFTVTPSKKDVTTQYTLPAGTSNLPPVDGAGPNIDVPQNYLDSAGVPVIRHTAEKNLNTKVVTISLTGTVADASADNGDSVVDLWYGGIKPEAKALGGNYAVVRIDGIFTADALDATSAALKNYNPSWAYYKGWDVLSASPSASNAKTYIDETDYNKSLNWSDKKRTSSELTLLLWSGPKDSTKKFKKEATLNITPQGGTEYIIIVDWRGLTIEESPAETLSAALGTGNATVSGGIVTLVEDTTLGTGTTVTVPAGVKLVVAEGKTLTVGANSELKVETGASVTVASSGNLIIGEAREDGAKLDVEEGATVSVSGTLTLEQSVSDSQTDPTFADRGVLIGTIVIEDGGVFEDLSYGQGALWRKGAGTGSITIKAGGKAYTYTEVQMVSGEDHNNDDAPAGWVLIKLTSGEFTLKKAEYILNGAATLLGKFGISDDMALFLKAGSILTIDTIWGTGSNSLSVSAPATITGESGGVAPKIIVELGNTIVITGPSNFYPNNTTTTILSGTYNWDAATGGWKAQTP